MAAIVAVSTTFSRSGFLYLQQDKASEARAAFQSAQTLSPSSPEPWLGQALCIQNAASAKGITEQQRKAFVHAHSLAPNHNTEYFLAAAHFLRPEGIVPSLRVCAIHTPPYRLPPYPSGGTSSRLHVPPPASLHVPACLCVFVSSQSSLEKVLAFDPKNVSALNILGCYYEAVGQHDLAWQALQRALELLRSTTDGQSCERCPQSAIVFGPVGGRMPTQGGGGGHFSRGKSMREDLATGKLLCAGGVTWTPAEGGGGGWRNGLLCRALCFV